MANEEGERTARIDYHEYINSPAWLAKREEFALVDPASGRFVCFDGRAYQDEATWMETMQALRAFEMAEAATGAAH